MLKRKLQPVSSQSRQHRDNLPCSRRPSTMMKNVEQTTAPYERLSKLLVHGQTMDDLGGSYRFTRIPSHVSVRYRFALVKVRRPSDSLILLVACPALYCPLLPFTALYCLLLSFTCPLLLFTAFYCPLPALYGPLLHGAVAHKTIW